MFLVRADCMESLDAVNSNYTAENVCLLKIDIDQVDCFSFNVVDRLLNMDWLQILWQL